MTAIRASLAGAILDFVTGAGGSAQRIRGAAAIPDDALLDRDHLVGADRFGRLFDAAATELGDEHLGLRIGAELHLAALGPVTYAVLNAPEVGTGLRNLVRFFPYLVDGSDTELEEAPGETVLRIRPRRIDPATSRHLQECGASLLVRLLRELIGPQDWKLLRVALSHDEPPDITAHLAQLGVEPTFGADANEIVFAPVDPTRIVPGADRSRLPLIERHLEQFLGTGEPEPAWLNLLRREIAQRLCDGQPTLATIAPSLGMSKRTLQRRLFDLRLSYRDLVQEIRQQIAYQYLVETDASLTEVAILLGYSELSAFDHAVARWTGSTPSNIRASAAQQTS